MILICSCLKIIIIGESRKDLNLENLAIAKRIIKNLSPSYTVMYSNSINSSIILYTVDMAFVCLKNTTNV